VYYSISISVKLRRSISPMTSKDADMNSLEIETFAVKLQRHPQPAEIHSYFCEFVGKSDGRSTEALGCSGIARDGAILVRPSNTRKLTSSDKIQSRSIQIDLSKPISISLRLCLGANGGGKKRRERDGQRTGLSWKQRTASAQTTIDKILEKIENEAGIKPSSDDSAIVRNLTQEHAGIRIDRNAGTFFLNDCHEVIGSFEIINVEKFTAAIQRGIGKRRSYGFGLIEVIV